MWLLTKEMNDMKTETVHVSQIQKGDTVMINGNETTIGQESVKNCPLMGVTVNGQNFRSTGNMIERVCFPKYFKGQIIAWVAQV